MSGGISLAALYTVQNIRYAHTSMSPSTFQFCSPYHGFQLQLFAGSDFLSFEGLSTSYILSALYLFPSSLCCLFPGLNRGILLSRTNRKEFDYFLLTVQYELGLKLMLLIIVCNFLFPMQSMGHLLILDIK